MNNNKQAVTVDTPELPTPEVFMKRSEWDDALKKRQSFNGWRIKYSDCDMALYTAEQVDAHTSEAVARVVADKDAEILALHRKFAAETLRADQGWARHEQANKSRMALEMERASQAAPVAASDVSTNLTHEREFLEDWLRTAAEPTGLECCGHGIGSECCGNPDAAYLSFDEFITAMNDRLKAVTALLAAHTQQPAAVPVIETGLPELRDLLKIAAVYGDPILLSSASAGALCHAMTTDQPAAVPAEQDSELDHGETVLRLQEALGCTNTGWISPDVLLLRIEQLKASIDPWRNAPDWAKPAQPLAGELPVLPPLHVAAQSVVERFNDPCASLASIARYVNELADVLATRQPAPVADVDREARNKVARAIGLHPNSKFSFAWEYLIGMIEELAKDDGVEAAYKLGRAAGIEEAAKVCAAKFKLRVDGGFPREASTARALTEEIRALNKTGVV